MSYLKFDKSQLVNLEYSLLREILRTNRAGSYCCTTLSGCNTRKYHGLLVCPNQILDGGKHVLLSSLDVTIIQNGADFNLGIHKFKGEHYEPKGHKYIRDFEIDTIPKTTYDVGGIVFTMERVLVKESEQVLIKYTVENASKPVTLRFKPFLAFRNVHTLSHSNLYANTKYQMSNHGISMKLYDGYPNLYMQFSKNPEYIHNPDWYYNIEYIKERSRGYEYLEDLFVPGYFEIVLRNKESIVFSASTSEANPKELKKTFINELKTKTPRDSFFGCLRNSAQQFVVKTPAFTDIQAGYPWYNGRINQTFIALPGLALAFDNKALLSEIIDTNINRIKNGLFPVKWGRFDSQYDAADSPLWFFWTIQNLLEELGGAKVVWKKYKSTFLEILNAYKDGTSYNIKMNEDGLISADSTGIALTWMNSYASGKPVTPRYGCPVEINALWYNAICFALELAKEANDKPFISRWNTLKERISTSFIATFWDPNKGYLADIYCNGLHDWTIRPNQVIATALKYTPLTKEMKKLVLSMAKKDLLTPRGLRTLSPNHENYKGNYEGNEQEREESTHQGTVFPWLIGFFIEGYLDVHQRGGIAFAKSIMEGFEEEMTLNCIGTISEFYNGNPPHAGKGAISQAWNIGQIMRAYHLIDTFEMNVALNTANRS